MEMVTIAAIVLGPFLGIWVHGKLEDRKTTYDRKLDIFKTLMATRATPLARIHVESLNRIDIEFKEPKEKQIRDDWAELLDHYTHSHIPPTLPLPNRSQAEQDGYNSEYLDYKSAQGIWNEKTVNLRAKLLEAMGKTFGYQFDKVTIKKAAYYPQLHGDIDDQQVLLLMAAYDVLRGNRPLGMHIVNWPDQTEPSDSSSEKADTDGD